MAKINNNETNTNQINLIGVGTVISGDINSNGDIRIDGSLTGKLTTKGKVVVGETGKVNGEIHCKNSDISGIVEGKVNVIELLSLKSSSKINGDITTNKLAIEPGSRFTGNCNMSGNTGFYAEKPGIKTEEEQKAV